MMRGGDIDLAILSGPLKSLKTDAELVARSPYVWVATAKVAQGLGQNPTLVQVLEATVITHARKTQAVMALEAECQTLGFPVDRIVHSSSLSVCVPMVRDGMGVALLPLDLVRKDVDSGRLSVIECGWAPPPLEFLACCNRHRAPNFVLRSREMASQAARVAIQ